jgi:hypothetical protein
VEVYRQRCQGMACLKSQLCSQLDEILLIRRCGSKLRNESKDLEEETATINFDSRISPVHESRQTTAAFLLQAHVKWDVYL